MLATELLPLGICFSFTAKTYEIQEFLLLEISLRRRIILGYMPLPPWSLFVLRALSAPGLHALPFGQHDGGQRNSELSGRHRPAESKLLKEKDVSFGKASKHS